MKTNKMKKIIVGFNLIFLFISLNTKAQGHLNHDSLLLVRKEIDMNLVTIVPDKKTAISIARAIWLPLYGKSINREKPYIAYLNKDDIWVVKGTFNGRQFGGVAYAFIRKKDGQIIYIAHEK